MKKGLSKWRSVHPCMIPVKPLEAMEAIEGATH